MRRPLLVLASCAVAALVTGTARLAPRSLQATAAQPSPQPSPEVGYLPWEDQTEADWIYPVATRVATVDGHEVHYPTPTAELSKALEARTEIPALRHLAEARFELGDRKGAVLALEKWAEAAGPAAWAETARWAASHLEPALAFRAAEKALAGLEREERRALATERIAWADAHPEAGDPVALRRARAEMFPDDDAALEDWIRALEASGALDAADAAVAKAAALAPERRLLLRSDLAADHGQARRAFDILDAAIDEVWSPEVRKAYAARVDKGNAAAPEAWRARLDSAFDAKALLRLHTVFQGRSRGDLAADLLRQIERRYESRLDRSGWLLLARLHAETDSVSEAFRARLAAAQHATPEEQTSDIAPLGHLALRAGGRPLPWGVYNDEPYRWMARVDRTPGFWTGGLSFLLTGPDWTLALAHLESESLPERTFATARALLAELVRRAPAHPDLPSLRLAVMERHVQRGDGQEALALLPLLEAAPAPVALEARRLALLAMRQTQAPLADELRLYRARLRALLSDGSRQALEPAEASSHAYVAMPDGEAWRRRHEATASETYPQVLRDAIARAEDRDRTHRSSLELILGEMDRLPDAEGLWQELVARLEGWNLDDDLGPRYEGAIDRFSGTGWYARAARWYARRSRQADLRRLADQIAARFRGSAIFERLQQVGAPQIVLEIPEQPRRGGRVRLAPWADWVRLAALRRFPHSPSVFREAVGRLVRQSDTVTSDRDERVLVDDALLDTRGWAILFVDSQRRAEYFNQAMKGGVLEARLVALEKQPAHTPVDDLLLFEGWSRLSRFERAASAASSLAAAYPGDAGQARRILSLFRSLAALDPSQAVPARALVERTAPAVLDPNPLWTELGELEEDRGRPRAAVETWRHLLDGDIRNPERISELATLLWDYSHMSEALQVVEAGRTRISRPRFFAFETGVLREEVKDLDGAIREYLASLEPETGDCFCSWYDHDQRSLRRLSQLLAREKVLVRVEAKIAALRPATRADEQVLASLLPLGSITLPTDTEANVDDWIDRADMPRDPAGRDERTATRLETRPTEREGIARIGDALLTKTLLMIPQASDAGFLDAAETWAASLLDARWGAERAVDFHSALMARRGALQPTEEARVAAEVERARYLHQSGRRQEADAVWAVLAARIGKLPEGAARMHAEAERAGYLERTQGTDAAAKEWTALGSRYGWSLGVLEDRLAFLSRSGRGDEARRVLEQVIPRAAAGHRETLLTRLATEALEAKDLPQARRAVEQILAQEHLDEGVRLGAIHVLARLSLREDRGFDMMALAKAQQAKLQPERHPDLYVQLARAAAAEKDYSRSTDLWIEVLNRRTDKSLIPEACREAARAGRGESLLRFFEKQHERSPRDVRWAVAVREIRLYNHDLEGAIAMAQAAVAIRPEQESLWREAAALLIRTGRVREAADFVAGWAKPRPADEDAAGWRSGLYARAGDGEKALAVEKAALLAYTSEGETDGLGERQARAARRLMDAGLPRLAWQLLSPQGDTKAIAAGPLAAEDQAELALRNNRFVGLLRERADDEDYRSTAARVLREHGRSEQRDEVRTFILNRIAPAAGGDVTALRLWWPFAEEAGLDRGLRITLAERAVAAHPGPWQTAAPFEVLEGVGQQLVLRHSEGLIFAEADIDGAWVRQMVRLDRSEDLGTFLAPRFADLVARVQSAVPMSSDTKPLAWTSWLSDRNALEAWVRYATDKPERFAPVAGLFAERRLWDRLWLLAARGWDTTPLLAALPEATRTAWFRNWMSPSPLDPDPVLRARGESLERVTLAVGHLTSGAAGAAKDPTIAKLRGPGTIGSVLASDPAWVWSEFLPRKDAAGESLETGEARVIGRGMDTGRLPGAFWGERPGEAYYVLETLARLREGRLEAASIPFEVPQRGRESERALVAVRSAAALGDPSLAETLDEAHPPAAADVDRLRVRLQIAILAGQKDKAAALLQQHVRRAQPGLGEGGFRELRRVAAEAALADPLDLLDPEANVPAALLAYFYDRLGPAVGARFHTRDPYDFRTALGARWSAREPELGPESVRYWLSELWAGGTAALPRRGLVRLGGIWPGAADWLERVAREDRAAALAALQALPDASRIDPLLARSPQDEPARILGVRVRLALGDEAGALALVDAMLAETKTTPALQLAAAPPPSPSSDEESGEMESEEAPQAAKTLDADPVAARLSAWFAPFRDAKRVEAVGVRFRDALAEKRAEGPVPVGSWSLALELTPAEGRPALLLELEHAWIRGDFDAETVADLLEMLSQQASDEAPRWLPRWSTGIGYDAVGRRARILARLKDAATAHTVLLDGRARGFWSGAEEVKAFDQWRRLDRIAAPKPTPPAAWTAALPFWTKKADAVGPELAAHLRAHLEDVLAARAVLRTAAAGDPEMLAVAASVLEAPTMDSLGNSGGDATFLRLRAARSFAPKSWRAARGVLGSPDPNALAADLSTRRIRNAVVVAALGDMTRIAALAGDRKAVDAALSTLEDLSAGEASKLRAEARALARPVPPRSFLIAAGKCTPLAPRDLDWAMVSAALDSLAPAAGGSR